MGLPFNGGPHGAYMSIDKNLIRKLPGEFVEYQDKYDLPRYRLAYNKGTTY